MIIKYFIVVNENLNKLKKDKKELEEKIELTKKNLPIKHEEVIYII